MTVAAVDDYPTPTAFSITLASLASSATAGRASLAVDNTSVKALDYLCGGFFTTGTTPTVNTPVEVWMYGSYDGATYSGGAAGTDQALTPVGSKGLLRLVQVIYVTATSNVKYTLSPWSVCDVFRTPVPPVKFGLFVMNTTVVALNATGTNHEFKYQPIKIAST